MVEDKRTPVSIATRQVLYVTYAPAGVAYADVANHHEVLLRNVGRFAPAAQILQQEIVTAGA